MSLRSSRPSTPRRTVALLRPRAAGAVEPPNSRFTKRIMACPLAAGAARGSFAVRERGSGPQPEAAVLVESAFPGDQGRLPANAFWSVRPDGNVGSLWGGQP